MQALDARLLREAEQMSVATKYASQRLLRHALRGWQSSAQEAAEQRATQARRDATWQRIRSWLADGSGAAGHPKPAATDKAGGSLNHSFALEAGNQTATASEVSVTQNATLAAQGACTSMQQPRLATEASSTAGGSSAQPAARIDRAKWLRLADCAEKSAHLLPLAAGPAHTACRSQPEQREPRLTDLLAAQLDAALQAEAPQLHIDQLLAAQPSFSVFSDATEMPSEATAQHGQHGVQATSAHSVLQSESTRSHVDASESARSTHCDHERGARLQKANGQVRAALWSSSSDSACEGKPKGGTALPHEQAASKASSTRVQSGHNSALARLKQANRDKAAAWRALDTPPAAAQQCAGSFQSSAQEGQSIVAAAATHAGDTSGSHSSAALWHSAGAAPKVPSGAVHAAARDPLRSSTERSDSSLRVPLRAAPTATTSAELVGRAGVQAPFPDTQLQVESCSNQPHLPAGAAQLVGGSQAAPEHASQDAPQAHAVSVAQLQHSSGGTCSVAQSSGRHTCNNGACSAAQAALKRASVQAPSESASDSSRSARWQAASADPPGARLHDTFTAPDADQRQSSACKSMQGASQLGPVGIASPQLPASGSDEAGHGTHAGQALVRMSVLSSVDMTPLQPTLQAGWHAKQRPSGMGSGALPVHGGAAQRQLQLVAASDAQTDSNRLLPCPRSPEAAGHDAGPDAPAPRGSTHGGSKAAQDSPRTSVSPMSSERCDSHHSASRDVCHRAQERSRPVTAKRGGCLALSEHYCSDPGSASAHSSHQACLKSCRRSAVRQPLPARSDTEGHSSPAASAAQSAAARAHAVLGSCTEDDAQGRRRRSSDGTSSAGSDAAHVWRMSGIARMQAQQCNSKATAQCAASSQSQEAQGPRAGPVSSSNSSSSDGGWVAARVRQRRARA